MIDISCDIAVNIPNKPLDFKILLDGNVVFDISTTSPSYRFSHVLDDNGTQSHILEFHLSGKTNEHTEFKDGSMVNSAHVELTNIKLNNIDVTEMALSNDDLIAYTHDCNGYEDMNANVFDSLLGYNGVVKFEFSNPLDEWVSSNTY
jgi:hypothetical protein